MKNELDPKAHKTHAIPLCRRPIQQPSTPVVLLIPRQVSYLEELLGDG